MVSFGTLKTSSLLNLFYIAFCHIPKVIIIYIDHPTKGWSLLRSSFLRDKAIGWLHSVLIFHEFITYVATLIAIGTVICNMLSTFVVFVGFSCLSHIIQWWNNSCFFLSSWILINSHGFQVFMFLIDHIGLDRVHLELCYRFWRSLIKDCCQQGISTGIAPDILIL